MKPKIRLKGFDGDWEEKKISDLAEINPSCSLPKTFEYVDLESVVGTTMVAHEFTPIEVAPSRAQRLAQRGDVFFQTVRPYQKNNYFFNLETNDAYVFSTGYAQLRPLNNLDGFYLLSLLQTRRFVDKVMYNCTGTSYPAINSNTLSKLTVCTTKYQSEQRAIGTYFRRLDELISSSESAVASLRQIKEASLQSMFPKEGETKPEVRFKGFEGDWVNKELGECLEISKSINKDNVYGKEDVLSVSDDFGVRNQIELLGRSFAGKSVSNYGILHKGEIVYTKSPLKSKPLGIIKMNDIKTGIVSVLYAIYKAKQGTEASYIHYYFDPAWRLNRYLIALVNKGAKNTMNISDETALTGHIMIPSISEQRAIASYFRRLDSQISLAQQRVEMLKRVKSACLDNMFV